MKISSTNKIIFNPTLKTVDTGIAGFDIRKLYAIINQTTGAIIYATGTEKGYTAINGDTVTLIYDTTTMSSTDVLQVLYDDSEELELMQMLVELSNRLAFLPSVRGTLADLRVSVVNLPSVNVNSGTITTVSTVTALTTLGNQNSIGGFSANQQIPSLQNNVAIQSNIQNLIIS